jgi:hypothetical protein
MNHRYLKSLIPVFAGVLLGFLASSVLGIQFGSETNSGTSDQKENQSTREDSPSLLFDPQQNPSQVAGLQFQIQQLTSQLRLCQADTSMLRLQELQNQMNTNRR